VLPLILM